MKSLAYDGLQVSSDKAIVRAKVIFKTNQVTKVFSNSVKIWVR